MSLSVLDLSWLGFVDPRPPSTSPAYDYEACHGTFLQDSIADFLHGRESGFRSQDAHGSDDVGECSRSSLEEPVKKRGGFRRFLVRRVFLLHLPRRQNRLQYYVGGISSSSPEQKR